MNQSSAADRRRDRRVPLRALANKYIDGMPFMIEILDASPNGFGIRTFNEPTSDRETFALELWIDDELAEGKVRRLFAWAKRVRSSHHAGGEDKREAYKILAADPLDRARLRKFLRTLAA